MRGEQNASPEGTCMSHLVSSLLPLSSLPLRPPEAVYLGPPLTANVARHFPGHGGHVSQSLQAVKVRAV